MENPHIIAISETVRVRCHDNISCNIRSVIFVFRLLTSIYSSLLDGYPSKPAFSLVNCDKNYARVILGIEVFYLAAKFSRVSGIWLDLSIRATLCQREEYRHFSIERLCLKVNEKQSNKPPPGFRMTT